MFIKLPVSYLQAKPKDPCVFNEIVGIIVSSERENHKKAKVNLGGL